MKSYSKKAYTPKTPKAPAEEIVVSGIFLYPRVLNPMTSIKRTDGTIEKLKQPKYTITVKPDKASMKLLKEKKVYLHENEDGEFTVQATLYVPEWEPDLKPEFLNKDPKYKEGELIGNDSEGKIKCELYTSKKYPDSFGLNLKKVMLEKFVAVPTETKEAITKNEKEKETALDNDDLDF